MVAHVGPFSEVGFCDLSRSVGIGIGISYTILSIKRDTVGEGDVQFLAPLNVSIIVYKVISSFSQAPAIHACVLAFLGRNHRADWTVQGWGSNVLITRLFWLRRRRVLIELDFVIRGGGGGIAVVALAGIVSQ